MTRDLILHFSSLFTRIFDFGWLYSLENFWYKQKLGVINANILKIAVKWYVDKDTFGVR